MESSAVSANTALFLPGFDLSRVIELRDQYGDTLDCPFSSKVISQMSASVVSRLK